MAAVPRQYSSHLVEITFVMKLWLILLSPCNYELLFLRQNGKLVLHDNSTLVIYIFFIEIQFQDYTQRDNYNY